MEDILQDFYNLPNIEKYESICLQTLSEQCNAYEEKVCAIMSHLSDQDRQILQIYIDLRNDLEIETFKTALRRGKQHYK